MDLLAEIEAAAAARRPGPACGVANALELLDPDEAEQLRSALARPDKIPGTVIADVLKRRDIRLDPGCVSRHRRGRCGCQV